MAQHLLYFLVYFLIQISSATAWGYGAPIALQFSLVYLSFSIGTHLVFPYFHTLDYSAYFAGGSASGFHLFWPLFLGVSTCVLSVFDIQVTWRSLGILLA